MSYIKKYALSFLIGWSQGTWYWCQSIGTTNSRKHTLLEDNWKCD